MSWSSFDQNGLDEVDATAAAAATRFHGGAGNATRTAEAVVAAAAVVLVAIRPNSLNVTTRDMKNNETKKFIRYVWVERS